MVHSHPRMLCTGLREVRNGCFSLVHALLVTAVNNGFT